MAASQVVEMKFVPRITTLSVPYLRQNQGTEGKGIDCVLEDRECLWRFPKRLVSTLHLQ